MNMIRAFVAVLIADDLKNKIALVQDQVKELAPSVKWVAPENFHVTLKFFESVPEDILPALYSALENAVRSFPPFDLSVSGLGVFPSLERARIVWVAAEEGCKELAELASVVDAGISKLGFEREEKLFKAHITLGRIKDSRYVGALLEGIGEIDASDLGKQRVTSIVVVQSDMQKGGPVYTLLHVVELGGKGY